VVSPGSSEVAGGTEATGATGGRALGDIDLALPDPLRRELDGLEGAGAPNSRTSTDGRLARGRRTRRNVAEALIELLREGQPDPTARAVAARAGVSLRLVFHHFADMDDLYHFVAALQLRQQWSAMPRLEDGLPLAARIERTVAHRAALFEEVSPVRRALARRTPSSPAVAQALAAADALLLESLRATFAPELRALAPAVRREYLGTLDAASSWDLWERLRSGPGVGVGARAARRIMTRMLTVLSAAPFGADLLAGSDSTAAGSGGQRAGRR
jgi:TetR/AcrR family transcriptional regulator, regulator of autoinduction and epiphytic fitness